LAGIKTWEIRRTNIRFREKIALVAKEENRVVGYATIDNSIEMTIQELKEHNDKHHANSFLDKYAKNKRTLYAWVLKNVEFEPEFKIPSHSTGSWCSVP
jgi:hypothetical protein